MRRPSTPAPSRHTLDGSAPHRRLRERGAVLVHMAIAMLGLISFSALVVDYGILWSARRQAQNAADAGAMAAAVSLAFVDYDNRDLARTAAINTARSNYIWGAVPDITDADVTFPPCPTGAPAAGSNACVRVDVFRNQRAGGNPLPTIFGTLVGITDQGVKATATAEVLFGDSADCVKPWAVPDKWDEFEPVPSAWDPSDEFHRYEGNTGDLLVPADVYERATPTSEGTGFTRASVSGSDYGLQITLKDGSAHAAIAPGFFYPVIVDPNCTAGTSCTGGSGGSGACCYEAAITGCSPVVMGPGDTLVIEPGNMVGPTRQGTEALIAQDPDAWWNPALNGGKGGIDDSCTSDSPPCGMKSPRLIAIPLFDPDQYDEGRSSGRQDIVITKILGFFIERMNGNDVVGRLMIYPEEPRINPSGGNIASSSFVISIALVR